MMRLPNKPYTPRLDGHEDPYYDIKLKGRLFTFCEHVVFLVKLNIFTVLLTLTGGVVLGIFPAMQSASDMCRLYMEGIEPPALARMWKTYKGCFLSANLVGWSGMFLVLAAFYSWFLLASTGDSLMTGIGLTAAMVCTLLAMAIFFYGFGVSVIYPGARWIKIVRLSIVLFFAKWYISLLMAVILGGLMIVVMLFPHIGVFALLSGAPCVCYIFVNKMLLQYTKPKEY